MTDIPYASFLELRVLSIEPVYRVRVVWVLPDLAETVLGECEANVGGNYDLMLDITRQEFAAFTFIKLEAYDLVRSTAVGGVTGYDEIRSAGCRNDITITGDTVTKACALVNGIYLTESEKTIYEGNYE